jgi:hypothetical protein
MPPSPTNPSDRLAKEIAEMVWQSCKDSKCSNAALRRSVDDFINVDHPETTGPIEMAIAAFKGVAISADGSCQNVKPVMAAILGFLKKRGETMPTAEQLRALKQVVDRSPVDHDSISSWFFSTFG